MVPEGWMHTSLGDLLEFKNGYNTEKANYGGGVPFVNVSEVLKHESLTADLIPGSVTLSEAAAKAYRVNRGDILFNRTSETTEEVGFTSVYLDEEPVIFGGFVIRGRPRNSSLFPEFARYAMRQPQVRSEIIRRSQGAVRSNVGQGELSKVEITLPPLPEQRKIADILSTWDAAIEKTEALLATARTQKRALMQSLLTGRRRFSEFEGQPWQEVRLGDVLDIQYGKSPKDIRSDDGSFPIIGTGGVAGYGVESLVDEPSVVIGRKGTIDAPQWIDVPFWPTDTTYWCHAVGENSLRWLYHWLSFINLRIYNEASGVPSLSRETLRAIKLQIPMENEQRLIARAIGNEEVFEDIHQRKVRLLQQEKKALMQQLLTGKRRVVVDA